MARKQYFDQRNCFLEIAVFFYNIFDENNVAKLVIDSVVSEEIIAICCHSLCCFLPTGKLVETRFFLFLNKFCDRFLNMKIKNLTTKY